MKISNNALNFLLAQYRAIFKRAYVKGIASAVILTAGLAIGQAQAAANDNILDADDFASGATVPVAQTITKDSTIELGDAEFANKFASNKTYINNQTIDGANVKIVGDGTKAVVVSGTSSITVQNGGSLTLTANKNDGLIFYGGDSGFSGTLTATGKGSKINLNAVTANFGNVTIETPEKKLKMQITLLEHRRLPSLQNELLLHITTAVLSLKVHNFIEN